MDPAHALGAGTDSSAEADASEEAEPTDRSVAGSAVSTDDETGSEDDCSLGGENGGVEGVFPRFADERSEAVARC